MEKCFRVFESWLISIKKERKDTRAKTVNWRLVYERYALKRYFHNKTGIFQVAVITFRRSLLSSQVLIAGLEQSEYIQTY